jgi:hypothetical protein
MPDPSGDDSLYEWIEIKNISPQNVQTSYFKINNTLLPQYTLQPNQLLVLARNSSYLLTKYPDLPTDVVNFSMSLSNGGGTVTLTDNANITIQTFTYPQSTTEKSFELLSGGCNTISMDQIGSTIGAENTSCFAPTAISTLIPSITPTVGSTTSAVVPTSKYSNDVEISEISACGQSDYITLESTDSYNIDLSNWKIVSSKGPIINLTDLSIGAGEITSVIVDSSALDKKGDRLILIDPSGIQKDVFTYPSCSADTLYFEILSQAQTKTTDTTEQNNNGQDTIYTYPKIYHF